MKKLKNGLIRGSLQKSHRFFEMVSNNCQKYGKKVVASDGQYFESQIHNHFSRIKPQIFGKNVGSNFVHLILILWNTIFEKLIEIMNDLNNIFY